MPDPDDKELDEASEQEVQDNSNGNLEQEVDLKTQIAELMKLNEEQLNSRIDEIKAIEKRVMEASEQVLKTSKEQDKKLKALLEKFEENKKEVQEVSSIDDFVH